MKKIILIFGNGYVTKFVAQEFIKRGWVVYCTSRQEVAASSTAAAKLNIINYLHPKLPEIITAVPVILSTVPPDTVMIDPVLAKYATIIAQASCAWVGYLSSTSVYGNHHGNWVNEATTCLPGNVKARLRLLAEQQWLELYLKHNIPVHILRLSGIYGPGRNCLEAIQQGKNYTIVKKDHYFSRIHIMDICKTIAAAVQRPTPGEIYNVSDDEPAPIDVIQQFGARILHKQPLREVLFADAVLAAPAAMFFNDNKKVSNTKIVSKLNIKWRYPNYRNGLLQGCLPYL